VTTQTGVIRVVIIRPMKECSKDLTQAPKRSGHALSSYLSHEEGVGRLLGGYSSAEREEQHAQSEVGDAYYTGAFVFSHN